MPYTAQQRKYFNWRASHPSDGLSRKEAKRLANEANKLSSEGKEKAPVDKANTGDWVNERIQLSREADDLLLAALGRLEKIKFGGKKNNNVIKARVPSKGQSRYDNPSHREGGSKASKKQRDAAIRDAINGLQGAVGWPGSALNTVRPMSSVR